MSLSNKLAEEGIKLIDKKGAGWIDDALDAGEDLIKSLPASETEGSADVIKLLRENKTPLVRLGSVGFAKLAAHWEDDDKAEARRHYLAYKATFAERRAAMHSTGDNLVDREDADKAAWDAVADVLGKVATKALPFLVKLAASAVGIPV